MEIQNETIPSDNTVLINTTFLINEVTDNDSAEVLTPVYQFDQMDPEISTQRQLNQKSSINEKDDWINTMTTSLFSKGNDLPFKCHFIKSLPGCINIELSNHMNMLYDPNMANTDTADASETGSMTSNTDDV